MNLVDKLLSELGLEQYRDLFVENDIDDDVLPHLTDEDLKEIGVSSLGHRKKIIVAVEACTGDARADDAPVAETAKPAPAYPGAERREVTTLFADLTSYTRLSREMETEDLHRLLSVFYDNFDTIVSRHGGTVERHIGDCVMGVFGAPVSYGNDAEHALRASLEMHRAMDAMSPEFDRELSVHIGVAAGNVLFSTAGHGSRRDLDFSLTGDSVNLASRLADKAGGGETLITEQIVNFLGDQISCDTPSAITVKGFDKPVPVYRFRSFTERGTARPLIGRQHELAELTRVIAKCRSRGQGEVLAIVGDAGLGKTRLADEFDRIAAQQGFSTFRSLILDFGSSEAQDPIRSLVRGLCEVSDAAEHDQARAIIDRLSDGGFVDDQSEMFIEALLGVPLEESDRQVYEAMSDEARNDGFRRTLSRLLQDRASERPLLLTLEDLHWADPETLGKIAIIAAETTRAPIICVLTLRPENDPLDSTWLQEAGHPTLNRLALSPLSPDDAIALARQSMEEKSEDLIRACVERAEGNPLFLDQLLRHAREEGFATVPGSIQSIVQARRDRLSVADRTMLEAAAILGQRFTTDQVAAVAGVPFDDTALVTASLIKPISGGFLFAHALIRDAVLGTMLRDQTQALHRRAADFFRGDDVVLYAEHLAAAGDERAGQAYLVAAIDARAKFRKEAALALAERGLALPCEDGTRSELLDLKGSMLRDLGRGPEAISAFEMAGSLAVRPVERCRARLGIIAAMRIMDRIDDAYELLDDVEKIATEAKLAPQLSEIHYFRGSLHFPRGDLDGCLEEHSRSLAYAEEAGLVERQALALSGLGDAYYARGRMFTAHRVIEQCLALCEAHGLVAVEAANRFMLATVRIYMNETAGALHDALASAELADKVGHSRAEIVSRLTAGWVLTSMGRTEEADREIERGLEIARQLGARRFEPFLEETLARTALLRGERERAEEIAAGALATLRELDAMSFIGPWVLSTVALVSRDPDVRAAALAEGETLLAAGGCVGHNYFRFYRNAIDACLDTGVLDEARRYADLLEAYTAEEPTPWSDFYIARARALADAADGNDVRDRLQELRSIAVSAQLMAPLAAIEAMLD